MRLRARDHCTSSTLIDGKGGAGSSLLLPHYAWGTNGECECKMDVKSTWIPTWHRMDRVFVVTWTILKNHLFGGRPNTKPGDHGTPHARNYWFILLYHVRGPAWIEIHWISMWLRVRSHMASHTLQGSWPHYMILEVCWDGLWTLFFWALTISWSWLLARVWSGP
jgi:hypothetical protein